MAKRKTKQVIPVSDTIPAPGTQEITIIPGKTSDDVPSAETNDDNDYIGNGTAKDIASTPMTTDPDSDK